ncbi:MAG TPA: VOC family protein [Solirubrobacteraceae bacterium]|nr:VOC family protein [Solirubrobacteraceae bacterium]
MTNLTPSPTDTAAPAALPAALTLGPVHLTVADLDRAIAWYERALGLRVHAQQGRTADLGDGEQTVIVLHEDADAQPPERHAGLYHYALLYPTREALARAALRLAATRTPIEGASDHHTHEAIYLPDVDGNGIELAWDRSRAAWPADLGYGGRPDPLDFASLMATVDGEEPTPRVDPGLQIGHVHLHIGDVEQAIAFYRDLVGFDVQMNLGSAAFVSAGGYHHHLGLNVWRGRGVGAPPAHTVGLRHWTVRLPRTDDVEELRARLERAGVATTDAQTGFEVDDPWSIRMRVEVAA